MNTVSVGMAPFHPYMVPFDISSKRIVFGGPHFICGYDEKRASGCIMLEVDTILVAKLVPLAPCSSTGSGTVTSGGAALDAAWGSWR